MFSIASAISAFLSIIDRVLGMFRDKQLKDEGRKDALLESLQKGQADKQAAARIAEHVGGLSDPELDKLLVDPGAKRK
jgi:hypothetical protein